MSDLVADHATLPPAMPAVLARIAELESLLRCCETPEVATEHVFHGGMYARTVTMPPLHVMTGVLIKRPTMVVISGSGFVLSGEEWLEFDGHLAVPASAGRKQVFVSRTTVTISMMFPTQAKSVEEAEAEFTDEGNDLLSRMQSAGSILITNE